VPIRHNAAPLVNRGLPVARRRESVIAADGWSPRTTPVAATVPTLVTRRLTVSRRPTRATRGAVFTTRNVVDGPSAGAGGGPGSGVGVGTTGTGGGSGSGLGGDGGMISASLNRHTTAPPGGSVIETPGTLTAVVPPLQEIPVSDQFPGTSSLTV